MKKVILGVALCFAGATTASATNNSTMDSDAPGAVTAGTLTVAALTENACASGKTIVKESKKTIVKVINGRLKPVSVRTTDSVCN